MIKNCKNAKTENRTHEGLGGEFHSVLRHQLVNLKIVSCKGCSHFLLSKEVNKSVKGFSKWR